MLHVLAKNKTKILFNAILLAAVSGFFIALQFLVSTGFADPDGYYHLKMAQLLKQGLVSGSFPWLPFTTWNAGFADQHYIYHWLLAPFGNPTGLHWSIVIFSVLGIAMFAYTLHVFKVRGIPFWVLILLASSTHFLFRINVAKANTLSLVLLLFTIILLYKQKYIWLMPIAFIFVWTYGGFIFLPMIVSLYCIIGSFSLKRFKSIAYCLVGISLGILFHPQSTHVLPYLYNQIFQAGLGRNSAVWVGKEWYPYTVQGFLEANVLAFGVWIFSLVVFVHSWKKKATSSMGVWLGAMSLLFFLLTMQSRRFVEYWVPFAVLFSAYALNPYRVQIQFKEFASAFKKQREFQLAVMVILCGLVTVIYFNLTTVVGYLRVASPAKLYQGAGQWLKHNSKPGDIVFNTQWDQFPQLFFWDSKNYYIIGMDPTFMYLQNSALYWQWRMISDDKTNSSLTAERMHSMLAHNFHARYIFVDIQTNPKLAASFEGRSFHEYFHKVYTDSRVRLFELQ